jgi:hypothetical protein
MACGLVVVRFFGGERAPGFVRSVALVYAGCGIGALQMSSVIEFPLDVDIDPQSLIKYLGHVGIGSISTSAGS